MGSDLRLLNKPVSVFPYLYSKRRSDPTDIVGQSRIATSVSSADFTVSLCRVCVGTGKKHELSDVGYDVLREYGAKKRHKLSKETSYPTDELSKHLYWLLQYI